MLKNLVFTISVIISSLATSAQNFSVTIEEMPLQGMPGFQSFTLGSHNGKWLILGGRIDGLHQRQPFASFLATANNTTAYVVDPVAQQVWSQPLTSLSTALNEQLQCTNMEFFQRDTVLYIVGGYGYSATAADHITHGRLTAVNVPQCIAAVVNGTSMASAFRSIADSRMAVTGGYLGQIGNTFHLVGGQYFEGRYNPMGPNQGPGFVQVYHEGIKRFEVADNGITLSIVNYSETTDATNLHRRDYNMVAQIFPDGNFGYTAFSGVFQPSVNLPWHNSVDLTATTHTVNNTFNQLLSQYHSAHLPIFDAASNQMHSLFFGGISRYYFNASGTLVDDEEVPFVNTISLVTRNADGTMAEQALATQMPALLGSGAEFVELDGVPYLNDGILDFDALPIGNNVVGHIVGGIESSGQNIFFSNTGTQSWASTRIFKVIINKDATPGLVGRPIASDDVFRADVFPNPATDVLKLRVSSLFTTSGWLEVLASNGQKILEQPIDLKAKTEANHEIDIASLASGTYSVRITNGAFVVTKKFQKSGR